MVIQDANAGEAAVRTLTGQYSPLARDATCPGPRTSTFGREAERGCAAGALIGRSHAPAGSPHAPPCQTSGPDQGAGTGQSKPSPQIAPAPGSGSIQGGNANVQPDSVVGSAVKEQDSQSVGPHDEIQGGEGVGTEEGDKTEINENNGRFRLILGDCLEKMKGIPDGSVDLVLTDPPYYRIMVKEWNGSKHEWDNQWATFGEYLGWLKSVAVECKRILKDNGSFYLFADDRRCAHVRLMLEGMGFCFINEIVWVKKNNMTRKGWTGYRCFAPITERILFFGRAESEYEMTCDGLVSTVFSPLRQYLIDEKNKVGITLDDVNTLVGTASMAGRHYFANSQWCFPTKEHYERMQLTFNVVFKKLKSIEEAGKMSNAELSEVLRSNYEVLRSNYEDLRSNYEVLRSNYEDLRSNYEDLRRYFSPSQDYTDVWATNITQSSDEQIHPTQKPISIVRRMVKTSTKEGDTVLDPFMGSGTTGVACMNLNRKFIGIELDEGYFKMAQKRIIEAANQEKLDFFGGDAE